MAVRLLPGLPGRDEDDLVQIETSRHLRSRYEVAVMDGIEGAAHHAETVPLVRVGTRSAG